MKQILLLICLAVEVQAGAQGFVNNTTLDNVKLIPALSKELRKIFNCTIDSLIIHRYDSISTKQLLLARYENLASWAKELRSESDAIEARTKKIDTLFKLNPDDFYIDEVQKLRKRHLELRKEAELIMKKSDEFEKKISQAPNKDFIGYAVYFRLKYIDKAYQFRELNDGELFISRQFNILSKDPMAE